MYGELVFRVGFKPEVWFDSRRPTFAIILKAAEAWKPSSGALRQGEIHRVVMSYHVRKRFDWATADDPGFAFRDNIKPIVRLAA